MAIENVILKDSIPVTEDLSAHQHTAISIEDGQQADYGHEATGILLNKPKSGEIATIGVMGIMKYKAGGGITKGDRLVVKTDGLLYTAGSGFHIVGTARETLSGANSIGTGYFNFAVPIYAFSSDFIN